MELFLVGLQAIAEICGVSVETAGVAAAMFSAGLIGGLVHCAGMCGPFVLAQLPAGDGRVGLQRLSGGALPGYHFGRAVTYTLLGAGSGATSQLLTATTGLRWLAATLLILAALIFTVGTAGWFTPRLPAALRRWSFSDRLCRSAARISILPPGMRQLGLGLLLGFLPCHMVYAGLATAAATGSAASGALAMAAFAAGTAPALVAVGWLGGCVTGRWKRAGAVAAPALMLINATVLTLLAARLVG